MLSQSVIETVNRLTVACDAYQTYDKGDCSTHTEVTTKQNLHHD